MVLRERFGSAGDFGLCRLWVGSVVKLRRCGFQNDETACVLGFQSGPAYSGRSWGGTIWSGKLWPILMPRESRLRMEVGRCLQAKKNPVWHRESRSPRRGVPCDGPQ